MSESFFLFLATVDALLKCSDISDSDASKLKAYRGKLLENNSLTQPERDYVFALGREKLDGATSAVPESQDNFLGTLDALILAPTISQSEKEGFLLYRRKFLEGALDHRDRAHVLDLARQLRIKPFPSTPSRRTSSSEIQPTAEHLRQLLAAAEQRIETLRSKGKAVVRERDAAEAKVKELQARLDATAGAQSAGGDRSKFKRAKMEFARLYHPDKAKSEGIERVIRSEIFKEFWVVLEKIEREH